MSRTTECTADGAAAFGGRNEWYAYKPNLDNRDEERIVILKGSLLTRSKRILQTWETSQAGARIRVLAYQLPGAEPPGVYYTFQSFSAEWSEWHSILTFRQDHFVPIPEDSVTFINDSVAYVFMGCMFAVATDGGKNWRAWDAERDYENSSLSDHYLIEHVEIDSSGEGTMTLICVSQTPGLRTLSTKDFGQHWN